MAIKISGEKIEFWDMFPVVSSDAVSVGDLCYWDTAQNAARPVSNFTWVTDAPTTRRKMKRYFVGVAAEAHVASGPNPMIKIIQVGKVTADLASATPAIGQMVGPDSANSLLMNQQVIEVQDPAEGVGEWARYYSANVTTAEMYVRGIFSHCYFHENHLRRTFSLALATFPASGNNILTGAKAYQIFGGAAEILAISFFATTVLGTNNLVITPTTTAGAFSTNLTATTATAVGVITTQSYATEANRKMDANDTLQLQVAATAPASGSGTIFIEYRKLS